MQSVLQARWVASMVGCMKGGLQIAIKVDCKHGGLQFACKESCLQDILQTRWGSSKVG